MESFLVSALKYRPTSFDEVVGQDSITKTLGNSLKTNQLPQALLTVGWLNCALYWIGTEKHYLQ